MSKLDFIMSECTFKKTVSVGTYDPNLNPSPNIVQVGGRYRIETMIMDGVTWSEVEIVGIKWDIDEITFRITDGMYPWQGRYLMPGNAVVLPKEEFVRRISHIQDPNTGSYKRINNEERIMGRNYDR